MPTCGSEAWSPHLFLLNKPSPHLWEARRVDALRRLPAAPGPYPRQRDSYRVAAARLRLGVLLLLLLNIDTLLLLPLLSQLRLSPGDRDHRQALSDRHYIPCSPLQQSSIGEQ